MSDKYHLDELRIALDPNHPAHILPPPVEPGTVILDLGCGAGQTMIAAYPGYVTFGLDVHFEALQLGRTLTRDVNFCCGQAERLPFKDDVFDLITARVSLAYTDIALSLREARRVLKPDGRLWITLHTWRTPFSSALKANWRGKLFFLYIILNSLSFHCFQRQFSLSGRQESYQTVRGIVKALSACGFGDITIARGRHFTIEARSITSKESRSKSTAA